MHEISKIRIIMLSLLLFSIIGGVSYYFTDEKGIVVGDSPQYLRLADNLKNHNVLSLEDHESKTEYQPTAARIIGYPLLLSLISIVYGDNIRAISIMNIAFLIVTMSLIVSYTYNVFGKKVAIVTSIFLSLHIQFFFFANTVLSESATNLLLLLVLMLIKKQSNYDNMSQPIYLGLIVGLASLFREPVLLFLVVGYVIFSFKKINFVYVRNCIVFLSVTLLGFSPWVIRNYLLTDEFVPLTYYAKGSIPVRMLQDTKKISLLLTVNDFNKIVETEVEIFSLLSKEFDYPYFMLFGNKVKQNQGSDKNILFDPRDYLDNAYLTKLKSNDNMYTTIKIESMYSSICSNYKKHLVQEPIGFLITIKHFLIRFIHLFSTNDFTPWKDSSYFHSFQQLRWYCFEIPLLILGLYSQRKLLIYNKWFIYICCYSFLVCQLTHVEPRYGLFPIILSKPYIALGFCVFAKSTSNKLACIFT